MWKVQLGLVQWHMKFMDSLQLTSGPAAVVSQTPSLAPGRGHSEETAPSLGGMEEQQRLEAHGPQTALNPCLSGRTPPGTLRMSSNTLA